MKFTDLLGLSKGKGQECIAYRGSHTDGAWKFLNPPSVPYSELCERADKTTAAFKERAPK